MKTEKIDYSKIDYTDRLYTLANITNTLEFLPQAYEKLIASFEENEPEKLEEIKQDIAEGKYSFLQLNIKGEIKLK